MVHGVMQYLLGWSKPMKRGKINVPAFIEEIKYFTRLCGVLQRITSRPSCMNENTSFPGSEHNQELASQRPAS